MISGTQNSMELLGKSKEELREFCVALGEPAFRGAQIYHALYSERKFDVEQITNLPAALRERLAKEARVTLPEVKQRFASADGSVRYLYSLPTGEGKETSRPASVEAVFMPSEVRPKLAISLNGSNDEQRDELMPINKKYPLSMLMEACKNYPLRTWEHLTIEYVMLGGLNDAAEDARRVVRLLAPLKSVKVNLIPWNPGELPYRESSPERIEEFRRILVEPGGPAFVRSPPGRAALAPGGQLGLL